MSVNAIQKSEELKEDCELWIVGQILLGLFPHNESLSILITMAID